MTKLLLLNGPPRCGKDTIAEIIQDILGPGAVKVVKLADELKRMTHRLYNQPEAPGYFEHMKDTPSEYFGGLSPRQAYIAVSERYVKPVHGSKYFGAALVDRLMVELERDCQCKLVVVADSGFAEEAKPLIDLFDARNTRLAYISRPGCDFSRDSRSYISLPVVTCNINNAGSLAELRILANSLALWAVHGVEDDQRIVTERREVIGYDGSTMGYEL